MSYLKTITIQNPYHLKIRPGKLTAEVLGLSSSQVKKLISQESITIQSASQSIDISVSGIYTLPEKIS